MLKCLEYKAPLARYLFALAAFNLDKFTDAEHALLGSTPFPSKSSHCLLWSM